MDHLPELGTAIQNVVIPTFKLYDPLLQKNAGHIKATPKSTHQYGQHERQVLDVYSPSKPSIIDGRRPVLMFEYGGGLVNGSRTLSMFGNELVYANVGAFFASKFGYTVVIIDYRLMSHGAKFPSGGQDVALAAEWIVKNKDQVSDSCPIDLFLMGNSAGGIHLSTFLLHSDFSKTRHQVLTGSDVRLRGAILLAVPFDFETATSDRTETLEMYFGDYQANSPLGLLKAAKQSAPFDFVKAGVRLLVLDADLDPEDEILKPRDRFVKEWLGLTDSAGRGALAVDWILGHNHISPVAALSTGIDKEEAWGCQVAAFCDGIRKFAPR
ncbi:hypothetical protein BAUCODRAFT_472781 [Baudoinia panamericana UAMH 10762]|uniref:BD-FAE-like domain-containing protein n=1 Tax=Baudoinia panamericana (strain UAMH 10762) TaxID=717646 RepID=M2LPP5_BAUPA|nr:uncharacterized protein BAUCODRAFT_472781 [Baudoinia panamericana UAMH 10762]EMC96377.1 hypothetical protein BAUCODRAFT_472781 [Baudoinia panamericana UAMH 10762]